MCINSLATLAALYHGLEFRLGRAQIYLPQNLLSYCIYIALRAYLVWTPSLRKEELFGKAHFDGILLKGPKGANVYTDMVYEAIQKGTQMNNPKPEVRNFCHTTS